MSKKARIYYRHFPDKNMLISEMLRSAKNNAVYQIHIYLETNQVKVKNLHQERIIKKTKELKNLVYAKRRAKQFVQQLGVEFNIEVRPKRPDLQKS